jgi:FeS assembly SUF system protein
MKQLEEQIVAALKTIYDPEIPVNIYDLGLIYEIDAREGGEVVIKMSLTAPNCPAAEILPPEVAGKVEAIEGISKASVNVVWEPPWSMEMMSEAAKLDLGLI